MPAPAIASLYGIVTGSESYTQCAIILCTGPIVGGGNLTLASLAEPTNAGYRRIVGQLITDIFPSPVVVPAQMARLVSRHFDMRNNGTAPVTLTGWAFIAWKDSSTPVVMTAIPSPFTWQPGERIGGRLNITSVIHDEAP